MASFQDKICWGRPRKRENKKQKKNRSDEFLPYSNRKFQKIAKHYKKLKTTTLATFQANICWERPRKKKKKIILMSSYQTRNRKFQKNSNKIQKFKKHHYGYSSSQNKLGKAEKERK